MKQSIFSHRPYNLSLFALAALNLAFAFFLFFNSAIADGEPFAPEIAVVNNPNPQERLNLREQPSEAAASLGKYYNGVAVQVDENLNNGWVHVTIGNGEGTTAIGKVLRHHKTTIPIIGGTRPSAIMGLHSQGSTIGNLDGARSGSAGISAKVQTTASNRAGSRCNVAKNIDILLHHEAALSRVRSAVPTGIAAVIGNHDLSIVGNLHECRGSSTSRRSQVKAATSYLTIVSCHLVFLL